MQNIQQTVKNRRRLERTKPVTSGQLDTSEIVELLQRSAVEHLTTYRQLEAREFGSVVTIVTTDFEALYTGTNVETISGVYSCLHRTYTRSLAVE